MDQVSFIYRSTLFLILRNILVFILDQVSSCQGTVSENIFQKYFGPCPLDRSLIWRGFVIFDLAKRNLIYGLG